MGFFQSIKTIFSGKIHEKEQSQKEELPTSIDNLKQGGCVVFKLLPEYDELSNESFVLGNELSISIENPYGDNLLFDYVSLENTPFFIRKDKNGLEVIRESNQVQDILDSGEESFNDIIFLDFDSEVSFDGDIPSISNNEKNCSFKKDVSWVKSGQYNSVQDTLLGNFNGQDCRYLRLQSMDKTRYLSVISVQNGETFFYESVVIPLPDVEFL